MHVHRHTRCKSMCKTVTCYLETTGSLVSHAIVRDTKRMQHACDWLISMFKRRFACTCTQQIDLYINTLIEPFTKVISRKYIYTCVCTCMAPYIRDLTSTHMNACIHTCMHAYVHTCLHTRRCDTLVDNESSPNVFVSTHAAQAYPTYMLLLKP